MRKRTGTSRITISFSYRLPNPLRVFAFLLSYDRYKYIISQQIGAYSPLNNIVQHN